MKKLFYSLFLLICLQINAQTKGIFSSDPIVNLENFDKQRIYFGYFLGFNSYDFKIDYINTPAADINVNATSGFNVGIVGDLRLFEYVNLRFEPGLYYAQRRQFKIFTLYWAKGYW